ncbi:MAG: GMC family oxidoreductase [Janthinobacterium lividum]
MQEVFDYVIVGAGSAGCVLANRLSADPQVRVLLLEAGPRDNHLWIHVPIGFYRTVYNPTYNWGYVTEPDAHSNHRAMGWPRGKVLGGSSSINGLLYIRGQHEDFDGWRELGNEGWGARDVLPYFIKSESQQRGADAFHGTDGPLGVSDAWATDALSDAFIQAAGELGIARNDDFNGARQEGAGYYQLTTRRGRRASTAKAFLEPAMQRANLVVRTGATATRIVMEGRRAVGIDYLHAGGKQRALAAREVVLSGGVVNSPQLLQLSGIGPAALLQQHGIAPLVDLPGVGENMQDHYNAYNLNETHARATWNIQSRQLGWKLRSGLQYLSGTGPLTVGSARAGIFARSRPELARPDIQLYFLLFTTDGSSAKLDRASGFTMAVCQLRPESRGSIHIKSNDPMVAPAIATRYLSHPLDQRTLVDGIRMTERLAATRALGQYVSRPIRPLPGQTDEQLLAFAQATGRTVFHGCGTCKMGPDPLAVVDSQLRVHGIEGLRVADASIMPTLVSGNTNAATIMIGEKAADLILRANTGAARPVSAAALAA